MDRVRAILQRLSGVAALVSLIGVITFFNSAALIVHLRDSGVITPLGDFHNPESVLTPSVKLGEPVVVQGTKCNQGTSTIVTQNMYQWVEQTPRRGVPVAAIMATSVLDPGCNTKQYIYDMPDAVSPGIWRLQGVNLSSENGQLQAKGWYSEWFTVTP